MALSVHLLEGWRWGAGPLGRNPIGLATGVATEVLAGTDGGDDLGSGLFGVCGAHDVGGDLDDGLDDADGAGQGDTVGAAGHGGRDVDVLVHQFALDTVLAAEGAALDQHRVGDLVFAREIHACGVHEDLALGEDGFDAANGGEFTRVPLHVSELGGDIAVHAEEADHVTLILECSHNGGSVRVSGARDDDPHRSRQADP